MRGAMLAILAGSALALGSTAANATAYIGFTTGCFGTPCTTGTTTATVGGLTFTQGTFNQNDSGGFLALGGSTDNLGSLALTNAVFNYGTTPFTLFVTFTQPGSLIGTYMATLVGNVTATNNGGVQFNFSNPTQLFTYVGGAFTLSVNNFSVSGGAEGSRISGFIQTLPVPEPATWTLMLLGFGGMGMALRRSRRRPALAQIA